MSNDSNNASSGIGVLGLLGITFVVLELTHYIDWSWWYVTMPFWGGFALFVIGLIVYGAYIILRDALREVKRKKAIREADERAKVRIRAGKGDYNAH